MGSAKRGPLDVPRTVSVRELSRSAGTLLQKLRETGRSVVVTDRGRPVGYLEPLDPDEFEDFVLEHAPEYIEARRAALSEFDAGSVRRLSDVVAEIESKDESG